MQHQNRIVILFTILLLSLTTVGQQQDGSVFERRITLNQQNQTLDLILDQISWQANVYFSYNATSINAQKKHTISAEDKSLYTILHQLFNPKKFNFNEKENQIIISRKIKENTDNVIINDSIPVKYFFLSGKLVEEKKGRPVKYASISIYNKPIGTISNSDGEFLLKIHPNNINDTIVISNMGYAQIFIPAHQLLDEDLFILKPISIKIKEVKVTGTTIEQLLEKVRENLNKNYSADIKILSAFYRETVKQDENYINVSEAVMEILKAPYSNSIRSDLIRVVKGRKSPDVQPFKWINFKLQGGPFTITKLDAVKNMESFIDKDFQELYHHNISRTIWYNGYPVYVVKFYPISDSFFPSFEGEMYVHRETFAIVHAHYKLNKNGLKEAQNSMIRRKPRSVKARPSYVRYEVNYQQYLGKWQLATAQASVKFKVKSKREKLNSEYHSVSDLLVTNIKHTDLKRFTKDEKFKSTDIFIEELGTYDEQFWENYNIIKPNEDLRKAFKNTELN